MAIDAAHWQGRLYLVRATLERSASLALAHLDAIL